VSLRCQCPDDPQVYVDGGYRDGIVFGACRTCSPAAEPDGWTELRPFERVLSEDELVD
jgi:hypothetical protein